MQFSIYQESRRGMRRSNQDRIGYCHSRDALLMLLADGMGGHLHGEVAAQIAVQFVAREFQRQAKPRLPDPRAFLRQAMGGAHRAILRRAESDGLPESPRTTCVACVVQDGSALWAHAGDSRLYHIRDGRILARTSDHSLVQQLIDSGRIREEAVPAHPDRARIFSCLGSTRAPRVDVSEPTRLEAGDTLILCSDGLWSPLSGKIISSALLKSGIMQAIPDLLDQAERRAGRECDNLSVIALTWEQQPAALQPDPPARQGDRADAPAAPAREPGMAGTQGVYLSDDEIERAIARIRSTLNRESDDKT